MSELKESFIGQKVVLAMLVFVYILAIAYGVAQLL